MKKLYGTEQSSHGHCYRGIFTREALLKNGIGEEIKDSSVDIFFPFGGSNVSATSFVELEDDEAVKEFLLSDYKTDYEDPTLVDIAEGIITIYADEDSITEEYIKKFKITETTRCNKMQDEAEVMIRYVKESSADSAKYGIDFDNPFYGASKNMRYSELCHIFKKCLQYEFANAIENQKDELDFYMELLETGVDAVMVRKYMDTEIGNHMEEFCSEHGLI